MGVFIVIGAIPTVVGFYSVLKGKIPFIKKYNGVKNISLHSRIEGAASLLIGLLIMAQYFIFMEPATFVISMLIICIISFVLEIVFKVI